MKSEELHKWSEDYAIKRRINMILRSQRLGYWRIVGKETQKYYIRLLASVPPEDRKHVLDIVVISYENCANNMKNMCDKERKAKLKILHRYAEGRF